MWTKIDPEAFERCVKDIPESEIDRTERGYTYYMVEGLEAFYSVNSTPYGVGFPENSNKSGMKYFRFHDMDDTFLTHSNQWE